jgi:cytochrome c-type biogenesis protein CcmH/NrfG
MLQSPTRNNRFLIGFSMLGVATAGVVAAITLSAGNPDESGRDQTSQSGIALNEMARISAGLRTGESAPAQSKTVAPVPSLIDGLKLRLAADPNDARGWALLAQSYAFIGQADLAEQAISHAVALGLDESDLRGRVASAQRSPHAGLPGVTSVQ